MKMFFALAFLSFSLHAELFKIEQSEFLKNTGTNPFKVLIFLNKDCPCTEMNNDYINELKKNNPHVDFLGIHSFKNSKDADVQKYSLDKKIEFPVINDPDLKIADLTRANRTPQAIIVNTKNNEIVFSGGISDRTNPKEAQQFYLKDALTELKTEGLLKPRTFRSLGCAIVR